MHEIVAALHVMWIEHVENTLRSLVRSVGVERSQTCELSIIPKL